MDTLAHTTWLRLALAASLSSAGCGSGRPTVEASAEASPIHDEVAAVAQDNGTDFTSLEALFGHVQLELVDGVRVAEVPLARRGPFLLVPAVIGGSGASVRLLFDTAGPNLLAPELLPRGESSVAVVEGPLTDARGLRRSVPYHRLSTLALGEDALFTRPVTVGRAFGDDIAWRCLGAVGLAGYSVTRVGAWHVDFRSDALRIAHDLDALGLDDYRPFPLASSGEYGAMSVPIDVEGRIVRARVDTGYAAELSLDPETFAALFPDARTRLSAGVTAFGEPRTEEVPFAVAEVRLGGHGGIPLTVEVTSGARGPSLGIRALRSLRGFAWDRSEGRILLGPPTRRSSVRARAPFAARWSEGRAVVMMARRSALEAGVQVNDVLIRADDLDLRGGGLDAYCELMLRQTAPRHVTVERDGVQRTLELPAVDRAHRDP